MQSSTRHVLLATLGGQPQIVTLALDLLLERSIPIREVIVIHPASYPRLQQSVERLAKEFADQHYTFHGQKRAISLHYRVLKHYGNPIHDIVDEQTADGILFDIDELLRTLKLQQATIHFCISGGRRLMAFFAFSAALLNFTHNDRLWHLYTPDALQEQTKHGAVMHLPLESGVHLFEVPFQRASQSLLARQLVQQTRHEDEKMKPEEHERCEQAYKRATKRQQEVLRAIASGQSLELVRQELHITQNTLNTHIRDLLAMSREVWPGEHFRDYRSIHHKFAPYFSDD